MNLDVNARYAPTHEWVRREGTEWVVGISDHAQHSLGDIVFADLSETGTAFAAQTAFGVVESVKAASDVYLPAAGTITAINEALAEHPELINQDCYGKGWLIRMSPGTEADWEALLSPEAYKAMVEKAEQ
jgi:glycine cleavage system H protein